MSFAFECSVQQDHSSTKPYLIQDMKDKCDDVGSGEEDEEDEEKGV